LVGGWRRGKGEEEEEEEEFELMISPTRRRKTEDASQTEADQKMSFVLKLKPRRESVKASGMGFGKIPGQVIEKSMLPNELLSFTRARVCPLELSLLAIYFSRSEHEGCERDEMGDLCGSRISENRKMPPSGLRPEVRRRKGHGNKPLRASSSSTLSSSSSLPSLLLAFKPTQPCRLLITLRSSLLT